jgi:propanediol utilization protein
MMPEEVRTYVERAVRDALAQRLGSPQNNLVPLNISARHLHIRQDHLEILFGPGTQLTKMRDLLQTGEFAAEQTVTVVGLNRRVFEQVRILGPVRKFTQVELSFTDGRYLGITLPPRISGDIAGTHPIVLVGPKGALHLPEGLIRAMRHIHCSEDDAVQLGVRNGQMVSVRTTGPMSVTLHQVLIRVGKTARREMHIDTDEANASGLGAGAVGEILVNG